MHTFRKSEPGLWTVGFWHAAGQWIPIDDFSNQWEAAAYVSFLNGGERALASGPHVKPDVKSND